MCKPMFQKMRQALQPIEVLKGSVVTMVKDAAGNTTLTQASDGWSFDMSDAANKLAYVHIDTEDEKPVIELGAENDPDKVKITNGEIDFIVENVVKTTIDADGMNTENINVSGDLKVKTASTSGGFVQRQRANGNVGWQWVNG